MGRPLYSRAFSNPVVRDPESQVCETWSYLNAFDPDSDEFFANENAVYEDFVDPVTALAPISHHPEELEEEDSEEERDVLVVRMGDASPITSEGSLSDHEHRRSSITDSDLARARLAMGASHDSGVRQTRADTADSQPALVNVEPAVRVRLTGRAQLGESRWGTEAMFPRRSFARNVSYHPYPQRDEAPPVPAPSTPIPVPTLSRRSAVADDRVSFSPSTPPRQTPLAHIAMSPPPSSTPRLYSWARNPSHAASPSASGPFTNPHARTSYAHLSPVLIRIRDVAV